MYGNLRFLASFLQAILTVLDQFRTWLGLCFGWFEVNGLINVAVN